MIKEEEIKYYRTNIIDKYVIAVATILELEERQNKIEYERRLRLEEQKNKLKYDPNYKQCKRCGEIKPLTEFYKNPLKSKGVFDYCKKCAIKRQKELYERQKNNRANNNLCKTA